MRVEGLVVKGAASRYTPGRRDARVKVKHRETREVASLPAPRRPEPRAAERPASYAAFDLVTVSGVDLRTQRWIVRRQRLEQLSKGWVPPLQLTPVTEAAWNRVDQGTRRRRNTARSHRADPVCRPIAGSGEPAASTKPSPQPNKALPSAGNSPTRTPPPTCLPCWNTEQPRHPASRRQSQRRVPSSSR